MVKMYNQMNKAPVKQAKRRICENLVTTCLKGKMYTPQPVDKNHLVNALLLCCCSHSLNGSYLQTLPSCSLSCSESAKCVTQTGIGLCHTFSHSTEANLSLWQWTFSIFMPIVSKSLQTNTKKLQSNRWEVFGSAPFLQQFLPSETQKPPDPLSPSQETHFFLTKQLLYHVQYGRQLLSRNNGSRLQFNQKFK